MKIKKKNYLITLICMFVFACLLSCGIFALADSVKFKLGITLKPSVYFALSLNINNTGEQWIFDNRPTSANPVVTWASVKNLTITLNNDAISTADSLELKVYNYNQNKYMGFEIYDTSDKILSTDKPSLKDITYQNSGALSLRNNAIINGVYTFKINIELYDTQTTKYKVYVNNVRFDYAYKNENYTTTLDMFNSDLSEDLIIKIEKVKINSADTINYSFNNDTMQFVILSQYITGDVEIHIGFEDKYWDGSVAVCFDSGTGTESDPFIIANGRQLALMSRLVQYANTSNVTFDNTVTVNNISTHVIQTIDSSRTFGNAFYELKNDIYLNRGTFDIDSSYNLVLSADATTIQWAPIGIEGAVFAGTFDGNNYTISGLYINNSLDKQGLFGWGNSCEIKKITAKNGFFMADAACAGILGYGEYSYINNCINYVNINISGGSAGGISGHCDQMFVNLCKNYGTIKGPTSSLSGAAGIIGDHDGGIISNCLNFGDVACYSNVGGIAGSSIYVDSSSTPYIVNCANLGSIIAYSSGAAGIVGYNSSWKTSKNCYVYNCYNTGIITASSNYAGVVYGNNSYSKAYYNYSLTTPYSGSGTNSNNFAMSSSGIINGTVTLGTSGQTGYYSGNQLYKALNAWVTLNKDSFLTSHGVELKYWTEEELPTFVD